MSQSPRLGVRERQRRAAAERRRVAAAATALETRGAEAASAHGLRRGDRVRWGENFNHEGLIVELAPSGMVVVNETAIRGRVWHLSGASVRRRQ